MDLPRFDPTKIQVSRSRGTTGPVPADNVLDVMLRGSVMNWRKAGLPGLFGIGLNPDKATVRGPSRSYEATNRGLMARARAIAFDPTQIRGLK